MKYLSRLRDIFNNLSNSTIGLCANEIIYDYRFRDILFSLTSNQIRNNEFLFKRFINIKNVEKTIAWINVKTKIIYNAHHRFIFLNEKNEIFLKLHHKYALFKISNLKFVNQRVGSFKILKKINNLTYKIDVFAY